MRGKNIFVLCAHNDDQVIGAGGTLAKYAKQGAIVKSIIFSFGEGSHPHLKPEIIIQKRIRESLEADRVMGGKGVAYLGIKEGKFKEEFAQKQTQERLLDMLKKDKPVMLFTHSINDPHPDHRAVANLVMGMIEDIPCPVYMYEVWTPFRFRNRYTPKLLVDISSTFRQKIDAILAHRSQKVALANLMLSVYAKAKLHGLAHGCKYAEVFDKVK